MSRSKESMEESGIQLVVSQSEVSEGREGKRWALKFYNCDNKLLTTKYIYRKCWLEGMRIYSLVYLNEKQLRMSLFDVENTLV